MTSNTQDDFSNISRISQPKDLNISLYQHQLASIFKMEEIERDKSVIEYNEIIETNVGVNADKTGYGKTLAMVTLVYRDKMEWNMNRPYEHTYVVSYATGRIKKTSIVEYQKLNCTLVLASQSIINQWYNECKKTPLKVKKLTSKKLIDLTNVEDYDIVLVSPTMYNRLVSKYNGYAWKRFIFDEPGHVRVPSMNVIYTAFIWLVTATPNAIIAKHRSCHNSFMFNLIAHTGYGPFSRYFGPMTIKNSDEFIEHSFSMPSTFHNYYKCLNPLYNTVKGFVNNKIEEMISAGNIQGAIHYLGGGETQNITELVKNKKTEEIEELKTRVMILNTRNVRNKEAQIKKLEKSIERLFHQITEIDSRYTDILEGECNICMEKISKPIMEPNCQNIFCGECLLKWLKTKSSCPLCRNEIKLENLIYINKDNEEKKVNTIQEPKLKTKVNTIISLIKNKTDGKFLIFSAWDGTFNPIRNELHKSNIKFVEMKGSIHTRQKNITSFKQGNIKVIFLNSIFNGSGINLQETTDIIVYHKMGDSTLNQIIGRANRLGRTEPLHVHHLEI